VYHPMQRPWQFPELLSCPLPVFLKASELC
jgi:hypothetical protein